MNLQKELQSIGLDEKEAKTYIATLEIGKGTAQELAKKAGLNRPTTYFVLERLMKMGLVSSLNEEKHQHFIPESPTQLERLLLEQEAQLQQRKEKTHTLVNQLKTINAAKTGEPIVKYYLGKEGILRMAKASFTKKEEGSEMWLAYSEETLSRYLLAEDRRSLTGKRIISKTPIHTIYSTESGASLPGKVGKSVSEKEFPLPADIAVYDDKVRITSFQDEVGIIIQNKIIAKTLQSLLKLALLGAKTQEK